MKYYVHSGSYIQKRNKKLKHISRKYFFGETLNKKNKRAIFARKKDFADICNDFSDLNDEVLASVTDELFKSVNQIKSKVKCACNEIKEK